MATKSLVSIVYFGFGYIVNNYCFSISLFCMIELYYYFLAGFQFWFEFVLFFCFFFSSLLFTYLFPS